LRLALLRPQLVSGVVAINGSASEKFEAGNIRMAVRLAPIIKLFGGRKKAEKRVVGGMKEHSADTTWITPDVVAAYTAPFRNDLTGTLRVLDVVSRSKEPWPLLPRLGELRAPVTLLIGSGATKPLGKPEDVVAFRAALPALRVDSIASAGAFVQEERPDLLIAAIKALR
jgi:pimeloyl-ACP methyl ester carboxylesterase